MSKNKKRYAYSSVLSIGLKEPGGEPFASVTVWRHQSSPPPYHLDDEQVWNAVDSFHQMAALEIVKALLEIRGVYKVEWKHRDGNGFIAEVDDN